MSTKDYNEYQARVATFLRDNKVKSGCNSPTSNGVFFSWKRCESCLRNSGGDRETHRFASEGVIFEADICINCVHYLAYGKLDDMTMLLMGDASTVSYTCRDCGEPIDSNRGGQCYGCGQQERREDAANYEAESDSQEEQ